MKTITWVIVGHLIGIAALVGLGLLVNDVLKSYTDRFQGVVTLLSTAFGIYCFVVNILYHKNQAVYLWINRLLLLFRRTHTYWLPSFDFAFSEMGVDQRRQLLPNVIEAIRQLPNKSTRTVAEGPTSATVALDDLLFLVLHLDDAHIHLSLDRKLLVPSHLYETYRHRFALIAEAISRATQAESVRLGITITFGDGVVNPYYGFFVRQVPAQLLRHFEASFLFGPHSTCRIEAGTESINIEGQSAIEVFDALSQVLALKAIPAGGPST